MKLIEQTQDESVRLRPLSLDDLDHVMTWVNDPEVIGNFSTFNHTISNEEEKKFLESMTQSSTDKVLSIEATEGTYLGQIGLHQINWSSRAARLALIIGNKKYQGKGYAQAVLRELMKYAFGELNLHKIWLITFETNKKMQHILEKTGFEREGILREEYLHQGKYRDVVRMAMLQGNYKARQETKND